ncbi:MAG: hypothetical protein ACRDSF_21125 [Pseudonocardiaceae bacterium]
MPAAAASSTSENALTGGLAVIALGLTLVVLARIDLGRFTRRWFARLYAKSMGPERAQDMVRRHGRFDVKFYRLLGWATVVAGCVAVLIGLIGTVAG